MRIIFARHAQSDANRDHLLDTAVPGVPLNETGLTQAQLLADRLENEPIEAVYATPITRSQQTAAPIASRLGLEVRVLDGLREIEAGVDEMVESWQRYVNTLAAWLDGDWDVQIEGAQSAREFFARYDAAVEEISAAGHACVLVVTHGGALRTWLGNRVPELAEACRTHRMENTATVVVEGTFGDWRGISWDPQLEHMVDARHQDVPTK